MRHYREIKACRVCGNKTLIPILNLGKQALTGVFPKKREQPVPSGPLELVKCSESSRGDRCGLVQLRQSYNKHELYGRDYGYHSSLNRSMVTHLHGMVREIVSKVRLTRGDLVVDIGSNDGTLLRFFKEAGMKVLGVDPAKDIAAKATASGIETLPRFFTPELAEEISGSHGPAALVTANNVFAHADDLTGIVSGIRRLLKPDGIFSLEVSYLAEVVKNILFDMCYHEHLAYHSLKPLRQ